MRTIIIIFFAYILYRFLKFYFTNKYSEKYNNINNYRRYSKNSYSSIDEKDIIDAEYEEIEVNKGNSDNQK
jgi:hypothetical protein